MADRIVSATWRRCGAVLAVMVAVAAGCSAVVPDGSAASDLPVVVVRPDVHEVGGQDVPDDYSPRDSSHVDTLADDVERADVDVTSADANDIGPPDVISEDPGVSNDIPSDPGPVADQGEDIPVAVGACAPDDTACWCLNDSHCNPSFSLTCRSNACDLATRHCRLDSGRLEGTTCQDGESCTTGDKCQGGTCQPGPWTCACKVDGDCSDTNPCTDERCNAGTCVYPFNTASCDDSDSCTSGDTCALGTCLGNMVCDCRLDADCGDGNQCTLDKCDAAHKCTYSPVIGACSDGDSCTTPDTCVGTTCVAGPDTCECRTAAQCGDDNVCTDDSCSGNRCIHLSNALACDDGNACTVGDRCALGACASGTIQCVDCGDGTCWTAGENCLTCPQDCGDCPASESNCGDVVDEDFDGLTDCQDPDCAGVAPCPTDECSWRVADTMVCGTRLFGQYNGSRGVTGSACGDSLNYLYSHVYSFTATATGLVRFFVVHEDEPWPPDEFNLYVLSGACNPAGCIGSSVAEDPSTTLSVVAGMPYFIVVGDFNDQASGYHTVAIDCL